MHGLVSFAMYDQVSVLVFLSVYILRDKRPQRDDAFLSSESGTLVEAPWAYARYVALLQDFLFAAQDRHPETVGDLSRHAQTLHALSAGASFHMFVSPPRPARVTFSREMDEASIRGFFMRDLPPSFRDIRDVLSSTQSRAKYRTNRLASAVSPSPSPPLRGPALIYFLPAQIARVKQALGGGPDQQGMAFSVWNQMQASKALFARMSTADENFFLLPATIYSDTPQLHSASIADALRLAQNLCMAQRVRG